VLTILNTSDFDIFKIDRAILCQKKAQNESFMMCPVCEYYPCSQLTADEIHELNGSPLMDRTVLKLKPRRCTLYIIKYLDGTLKEAPELDPSNPDAKLMQNVDTVYQIGKELVPVIILKPKPKEERKKIYPKEAAKAKPVPNPKKELARN
jgi:hypothetical protein